MKNLIKKIGAVFLSLTVAASLLAGCGAKTTEPDASADKGAFRTLEEIKSSGTINIGVFSDKSPFGYVDENGEYSILARTMICTTDMYANKPGDGLYRMDGQKIRWGSSLLGENQFQYATRICGKLLFHSINYSLQYPDMIKPESYATLGTAGSEGSVLLLAADAKWIYDNVPAGTPVRFLSTAPDSALLESLAAPALGKSGYDPTDPRDNNPDYDPSYEASKPEVTPYPGVTPAPTDGWEFRTYP